MVKLPPGQTSTRKVPVRALRATVQRRVTSTRREMHRQLSPQATTVSHALLDKKQQLLRELGEGCVYCGRAANTLDHIEPLVVNCMPTSLIPTELDVLPCCSRCNSSKGSRPWRQFMRSIKTNTPAEVKTHAKRQKWLTRYDRWRRRHAQRWNIEQHHTALRQLNTMVDEAHAFMQGMVNDYVTRLHGPLAVTAHARQTKFDWTSIQCQMMDVQ